MCIQFAIALSRIKEAEQINWVELLKGLDNIPAEIEDLLQKKEHIKMYDWDDYSKDSNEIYKKLKNEKSVQYTNRKFPISLQKYLFYVQKNKTLKFIDQEIKLLKSLSTRDIYDYKELQHIIIVPHVKEPVSILRETMDRIKDQTFNTKQINVVLAAEAADPNGVKVSEELKKEYGKYFNNIWITNHVLSEGEVVGKSANMDWAGRQVHKIVKEKGWDMKKTTVTSCDADSKFDLQYFAYMTFKYITTEYGEYKYYASAMIFYNNIFRLPFYARVKNSFHSIFNAAALVRADKLVPFSTYTTSFWVLEQIDFWDPWITPEDYHLFFKAIFTIDKHVSTVPLFLKTLSDAAEGEGHWSTIMNNYKQSRRWAWGISDGGWMIKNFFEKFGTSTLKAKYATAHVIFDHVVGLSIAFLVLLGGIIPGIVNPEFSREVSGVLFVSVTSSIVNITIVFLVIIIFLDFFLKPYPSKYPLWKKALSILEWFSQPFASFFLSALPNLEAQSRLVFGQYLEYYVTKKKGAEEEPTKTN